MVQLTTAILLLVAAIGTGAVSVHRRGDVPVVNRADTRLCSARPTELNDYLTAHNDERAKHGAKALIWDENLVSSAQAWANQCKFDHSQSGQNLYAGSGNPTPGHAIGFWNAESKDYNPENPISSHWTQVVWKGTTKLGCAMKQCPPGTVSDAKYVANYYVCHYGPAGNVEGQFLQNVQK
ncbi:hypothetical protein FRC11_012276 [Ceratobasidium sp. 423]|nr:hypothetical protein FRC11_012276 [Ceratobasidium sp. 423]